MVLSTSIMPVGTLYVVMVGIDHYDDSMDGQENYNDPIPDDRSAVKIAGSPVAALDTQWVDGYLGVAVEPTDYSDALGFAQIGTETGEIETPSESFVGKVAEIQFEHQYVTLWIKPEDS